MVFSFFFECGLYNRGQENTECTLFFIRKFKFIQILDPLTEEYLKTRETTINIKKKCLLPK